MIIGEMVESQSGKNDKTKNYLLLHITLLCAYLVVVVAVSVVGVTIIANVIVSLSLIYS